MRGSRRDLAITTAVWCETITDDRWQHWEQRFQQEIDAELRSIVNLCLLDFKAAKNRHYSEERVSSSELRKRIKRLLQRAQSGKPLDDAFAEDQIYKHNLDDQETDFSELAQRTLNWFCEDNTSVTMPAPKPESVFTHLVFEIFKDAGKSVKLTSGKVLEFESSDIDARPTPIEDFILVHVLEIGQPKLRHLEAIRKNIKRFQ